MTTAMTIPTPSRRSPPAIGWRSKVSHFFRPRPIRGGRHRDVQGNAVRAGVLGAGDGLTTNISLILGVAGATTNGSTVRLAGIASLLAGAFSMAAGELVSVRAHDELVQHEIDVERRELSDDPAGEQQELAAMYRAEGVPTADADTVVIDFKIPAPRFFFFMTYKYDIGVYIVPKHIFEGQDWTTFKHFDLAKKCETGSVVFLEKHALIHAREQRLRTPDQSDGCGKSGDEGSPELDRPHGHGQDDCQHSADSEKDRRNGTGRPVVHQDKSYDEAS